jgi:predicted Zn-dependent peptidase
MRLLRFSMIFLLVLAMCPAGWSADTGGGFTLADFEKSVTEFTLANGMKFIVVERHQVPVVAFNLYVDVGAVDEVTGITGVSHLFEHMAFKGTKTIGTRNYAAEKKAMDAADQAYAALQTEREKLSPDPAKLKTLQDAFDKAAEAADNVNPEEVREEFSKILERSGAEGLNAGTAYDSTQYVFSLPSNKLELWFSMESARFLDPVLREFYKERDVVLEERNMRTESDPFGKLLEDFLAAAYKAHPYHSPVVGHQSEISQVRRPEAEKYFRDHYVASAMTAAIVGDVNPKEVKRLAETYFGRLPKKPHPEAVRTVEPPQNGEHRVEVEAQAQPYLLVGFHKADVRDKDHAVFEAISDILGEGRTSWLYKSLVKDKKIAVAAEAITGYPGDKYPGLFVFFTVPSAGHTVEENLKAVEEQIDRLKTEKIPPDQLEQVKTRTRAGVIRSLRSMEGLAGALAQNQALEGDWRQLFKDIDEIGAVTADDIQRVAKACFEKKNRTIGVIVPPEKPKS